MKDLLTTGEAAGICKVSQQTIIRCFDAGRLEGFRIPGSRFRRIPRQSLIKFMSQNNIPLDNLDSGKKKVLIVDDDPEIVELLEEVLGRDQRYEIKTASSGYDAGMLTEQFRPDLVCQTIRRNPEFASTKIIIVSGVVKEDEIEQLLKSGAEDFIRKPFSIDELTEKIATVLNMERVAG